MSHEFKEEEYSSTKNKLNNTAKKIQTHLGFGYLRQFELQETCNFFKAGFQFSVLTPKHKRSPYSNKKITAIILFEFHITSHEICQNNTILCNDFKSVQQPRSVSQEVDARAIRDYFFLHDFGA